VIGPVATTKGTRMRDVLEPTTPDLDDDDIPVGRVLSRREVLAVFGLGGVSVAALAACGPSALGSAEATPTIATSATPTAAATATALAALPACVAVPELTEGPYYVDGALDRSDIRTDSADGAASEGVPLTLNWVVSAVDGDGCVPLEGAVVDVWHCDAEGVYSGVSERRFDTTGHDFLRGVQRTDAEGRAAFQTIYPGWYQGRAVHIHFKIRTDPDDAAGYELTSQLFFPDEVNGAVFANAPYEGSPDTSNGTDGIFGQSDGTTLLEPEESGDGYAATFSIALAVS
jgi:protocatechuate 3,4-dioxygenase beta subunit